VEFSGFSIGVRQLRRLLPLLLGAAGGFAYYYFISCTTGSCPITSNPWISTGYGALVGAMLAFGGGTKSRKTQ
jgi:hypothetical protein